MLDPTMFNQPYSFVYTYMLLVYVKARAEMVSFSFFLVFVRYKKAATTRPDRHEKKKTCGRESQRPLAFTFLLLHVWNPQTCLSMLHSWILFFSADESDSGVGLCGWLLTMISWGLVLVTLPFSLCVCFKVVQEYERAVIFRLGRLLHGGSRGPGMCQ